MRRICRPAAMLLSLILLALAMPAGSGGAENALPAGRLLLIRDAAYDPESGILTVKWKNTGSVTVTGAEIRIHPVDAEGAPVIIGEGEIEDILLEERVLRAFTPVEPGKEAAVSFGAGELYPGAAGMEFALDRIEQTVYGKDGEILERTVLELPDNRLCWYSTGRNAYAAEPESGQPYAPPDDEVRAMAAKARLGITAVPVPGKLAEAYGFAYGGLLVTAVEEGSPAERIGLEPWDLIVRVNDMDYEAEPYLMTRACAEIAAGQPVTLLLERDNELWELTLTKDE